VGIQLFSGGYDVLKWALLALARGEKPFDFASRRVDAGVDSIRIKHGTFFLSLSE
jgi:hypothetical protein